MRNYEAVVPLIRYYTFDLGDRTAGLLLLTQRNDGTITRSIETVSNGRWLDNPDEIKYFWGYGGIQLDVVQLSEEEAGAKADGLGVPL